MRCLPGLEGYNSPLPLGMLHSLQLFVEVLSELRKGSRYFVLIGQCSHYLLCCAIPDPVVVQRKAYPSDFRVVGEILLQRNREHVALLFDRDAAKGQIVICPPRPSGLLHHRCHGERVYGAFRDNEHIARALQRKRIPLVAAIHLQLQCLLTCGALHGMYLWRHRESHSPLPAHPPATTIAAKILARIPHQNLDRSHVFHTVWKRDNFLYY